MDVSIEPDFEEPLFKSAQAASSSHSYHGAGQSFPDRQFTNIDRGIETFTGERISDRRFMGGDTLDEPISTTLVS